MTASPPKPPPQPGWYPDPGGKGQRYWDGNTWGPTAPRPPQPKRRGVGWLIVLGVLLLCPGSCIYGLVKSASHHSDTTSSSTTSSSTPTTHTAAPAPAPPGRIGHEVRDGKFAFTVTKVTTSPDAGGHTAQGTYVIVSMTVRNTSTEPWSFFATAQKLKDFAGREFEASMGTFSGDFHDGDDINPGNQITAKIALDVPPDPILSFVCAHAARLDVLRWSEGQPRPMIGCVCRPR
jgi:Domain of unknown function (DUF4352)/Protein of unknown function (DUF2510)